MQLGDLKFLKKPEYWLLGIGTALTTIYLYLMWNSEHSKSFYISFSLLAFIWFQLKERRQDLNFESGSFSTGLGILLLVWVFINSTYQKNFGLYFFLTPLISGLGLALLASGFKGLKQYSTELLAMSFISARTLLSILSMNHIDISVTTAKFATIILWYTGFKVSRHGVIINLPKGSVEVYGGCSGMDSILDMLSLSVLFIFVLNLNSKQKFVMPIASIVLGFIVNGFRVALMAILVAQGDDNAFKYWHEGDGSLIFSIICALLICCLCWLFLSSNERKNQNITD